MIGQLVGSYRIVRQLGEGGMGVVYIGRHRTLGHEVAIKLLKPELSSNPDIVNRFFDEARASSLVQHPAIVEVFDFGTAPGGAAYFVMELLEGESLAERMSGPAIGPAAAARVGRQVAEALATTRSRRSATPRRFLRAPAGPSPPSTRSAGWFSSARSSRWRWQAARRAHPAATATPRAPAPGPTGWSSRSTTRGSSAFIPPATASKRPARDS